MTLENGKEYVLTTARELYGRVVYTHKTHELERENWSKVARRLIYVDVLLVSLTTVLAIISATIRPVWSIVLTAVFASATTALVVWQSSFDPVGKENQHRTAAKELLWVREQLLLLIVRCHLPSEPLAHLHSMLESITREVTAIYKFAPNTSREAYQSATAFLKSGEFTFSDDEIDAFLPARLRKNNSHS
jgi:hypothetical protein